MAIFRPGPITGAKIAIFDQYLTLASMTACWTVKCRQHFRGEVIYSTERPRCLWQDSDDDAPYISEYNCLLQEVRRYTGEKRT